MVESNAMSDKQKRILYCESNIDGTIGGSFYSLLYLVEGVDKSLYHPLVVFYTNNSLIPRYREAGIDVEIYRPPQPVHINVPTALKVFGIFFRILQSATNFYRFFIREGFRKSRFIRRHNIDLVHLNNSIVRNHDWMLGAKLAGVKCITHERGINNVYPFLAKYFSSRIDGIICISTAVKQALLSRGVTKAKLEIIHNGLDPERVKVKRPAQDVKNEFNVPEGVPVVGMIGNIKSWKGQEVVIRAIDIVKQSYPQVRCLLVGDMSDVDRGYYNKLLKLIETMGLQDNVIFTGYQANVADFINVFDVMIHASIDPEPFGRVLIEGMALAKPLVGARDGAVPEIIVENETGFMFEPSNHAQLANALCKLLENPALAARMGRQGRQRLQDEFHIARNVERTEVLYRTLFS